MNISPFHSVEKNPRNLIYLLMAVALVSSIFILSLTSFGIHRVFSKQVVASAEEEAIRISYALLEMERERLLHPMPDGKWRIRLEEGDAELLDERLRRILEPFEIIKIKIYDDTAKIVYSTDRSIIGHVDSKNSRLAKALAGFNDSKLEKKEEVLDLSFETKIDVDVVETYVPIEVIKGTVIGSFEIYRDVTEYRKQVSQTVARSTVLLAFVLAAVFCVSLAVVRLGTRQVEVAQERLREMAIRDHLTGIFNRGEILKRAQDEVARLRRREKGQASSMGVIMLDIDDFKKINDTHGHLAGDEVLKDVSDRIRKMLRPYDLIGRVGGEEFVIIVPGSSFADTHSLAERIRNVVREKEYSFTGGSWPVTVSIGITISDGEEEFRTALNRADQGLYIAKNSGRDRVAWVGEPSGSGSVAS